MMISRDRCRNTPRPCLDTKLRSSDRAPARGLHQGQRSEPPRTKTPPGRSALQIACQAMTTHHRPPHRSPPKSPLAQTEPSTQNSAARAIGAVAATVPRYALADGDALGPHLRSIFCSLQHRLPRGASISSDQTEDKRITTDRCCVSPARGPCRLTQKDSHAASKFAYSNA